jgi:hypothetical protein
MFPLLCLSPALLDHSFPRDDIELWNTLDALGELQQKMEENEIGLVMTEYLRLIADEGFDYTRYNECAYLRDIRRLIQEWVMYSSRQGIEMIDVSEIKNHQPHPSPENWRERGLITMWQDEVGKIFYIHDRLCDKQEFFVGVACDSAFAGGKLGEYHNPDNVRSFPLVGPDTVSTLSDAYEWYVPDDIHRLSVKISDFRRNYRFIGAVDILPPSGQGGSHCPVKFRESRSWPLDIHYDPIPREHLRTLSQVTKYPVKVLKDSLINGRYPRKVCRFDLFGIEQ